MAVAEKAVAEEERPIKKKENEARAQKLCKDLTEACKAVEEAKNKSWWQKDFFLLYKNLLSAKAHPVWMNIIKEQVVKSP